MVSSIVSLASSAYNSVLEPGKAMKAVWGVASVVGTVASYCLWKGYTKSRMLTRCGHCRKVVLFGMKLTHHRYSIILGVTTAIFMGMSAIALIQATRPLAFWLRQISKVET